MTNTGNDETPKRPERVRQRRSGPQIYGQDSTGGFDNSQGVIRKDIPAKSLDDTQDLEVNLEPVMPDEEPEEEGAEVIREAAEAAAVKEPAVKEVSEVSSEGMAKAVTPPKKTQSSAGAGQPQRQQRRQETQSSASAGQPRRQQRHQETQSAKESQSRREASQERQPVRQTRPRGQKKSGTVTRMMEASRRVLRSPLLIVVAICQTVYLLGGIAAVFMRELGYGQFAKLIASAGVPDQLSGYMSVFESAMHQLDTGAVWAALAIRIPDLLLCIGLWVLIVTVRTAKERMSGMGYFFFRLYIVIHMIVACVLLLAGLVVSVTLVIASWSAGSLMALAIGVLIAAIILTMVIIMYYFCYLGTVKAVQMNASRGDFYSKVSIFVAVVHIIYGLTGIISILSGIVNTEITGLLTGAGRIGWMVLFGIWIFCYRRVMKPYEEG